MSPTRPRVLFVAPVEPWCRENGASVITADLLHGLARVGGADVLPIFLRRPPAGYRSDAPAGLVGIQLGLEGVPKWVSVAKALATGSTPMRLRFDNARVAALVEQTTRARGFRPTVVHVEHLPLVDIGIALARAFRVPLVYRSHNHEALLLERRLAMRGPLARMMVGLMARAEAKAAEACDLTLCISQGDLDWVHRHARAARAELFPCSLLLDRYDALSSHPRASAPTIGFAGGLDWAPNLVGLRWFVQECLPLVIAARPDARLAVLARGAAAQPWLAGHQAVDILPDGGDARELFASSWVTLAPLLQGGGVRIKIPESLALGCPVVATTIGAEGHDLPAIDRADEPRSFAEACVRRLAAPPDANARAALRSAVDARHGATVLGERLVARWSELALAGSREGA